MSDSGVSDSGADGGLTDAGAADGGLPDAGMPNAGSADAGSTDAGSPTVIIIQIKNFTFSPLSVTVPAGGQVKVTNLDSVPHSVTSEAAVGNFTFGSVGGVSFNTGNLGMNQSASFTIPASAAKGTVVPWYCAVHTSSMPQGQLTVQ